MSNDILNKYQELLFQQQTVERVEPKKNQEKPFEVTFHIRDEAPVKINVCAVDHSEFMKFWKQFCEKVKQMQLIELDDLD